MRFNGAFDDVWAFPVELEPPGWSSYESFETLFDIEEIPGL